MRFWQKKWRLIGNQRGFTLIELLIVIAIIGILTAIALPIYSNMQARARIAKAQADLRGLLSAVVAFGAHCGDVPATKSWSAALAVTTGTTDCATAVAATAEAALGKSVTDANGVPAGPFYTKMPTPPAGWTYDYTWTATGAFTVAGTNTNDIPSTPGISFP